MDISVITVTYNSKEFILNQIQSVFDGCNEATCEVIIVDNASTDGTVEALKEKFPNVTVIVNDTNAGFGVANNQGLAKATGEFLLFLNPDMKVEKGSLDIALEWMKKHQNVGIMGPKLLTQSGETNMDALPRRFPHLADQLAMLLKLHHAIPQFLHGYLMKGFNPDKEQDVDSLRGAFMLTRRSLTEKLGWMFDPRYFIWFEDVDTCREAWKNNYRVVYSPIISCTDFVGRSFAQRPNLWKQRHYTRSMLTYFQKWEPWYKWMWIALVRPLAVGMVWLREKLST